MALLMQRTGVRMVSVNYRGTAEALLGLLGGEVQVMFGSISSVLAQARAGKLIVLAVSTKDRFAGMPDVPTVAEAAGLPGFDVGAWQGVLVPAATSKSAIGMLRADMAAVLKRPDVQAILARQGNVTVASTPEAFAEFIDRDILKWATVLKSLDAR
jgi:tripartite-type tricarboxylate transporter receptor subunit TctC